MRWIKRVLWMVLVAVWAIMRLVLYGLRMAVWLILTMLRKPIQMMCGLMITGGLFGGMILMPLILYFGGIERNIEHPFWIYVLFMGLGFCMMVGGALVTVFYDALLFKLQPEDREIIYY